MLSIRQVMQASEQRAKRLARQEKCKFLYHEYFKFEDIKDFAKYFAMDLDQAIYAITQGRVLTEKGL